MTQKIELTYHLLNHWEELGSEEQLLVNKAIEARDKAYAPYSQFLVGAAALLKNGELVLGNNQENIAYPSGLCAERVALFYAGANFPDQSVKTLCIVAKGDLLPHDKILSPCGSCRQVMLETENRQQEPMKILLVSADNRVIILDSAHDLMPFAFGID